MTVARIRVLVVLVTALFGAGLTAGGSISVYANENQKHGPVTTTGLSVGWSDWGNDKQTICGEVGCGATYYPYSQYAVAQAFPAAESIHLFALSRGARFSRDHGPYVPPLDTSGAFDDAITFFNPNPVAIPIGINLDLRWNVQHAQVYTGFGEITPSDYVQGPMAFDFTWGHLSCMNPAFYTCSATGPQSARISGTVQLNPGTNTLPLGSNLQLTCWVDERPVRGQPGICDYMSTLSFDLGSTGVTFTTESGVTLTSIPEPSCLGISSFFLVVVCAMRKATRPA